MTTLVTGATGGLGRNAVDTLLARGARVRATGRDGAQRDAFLARGADYVPADLARLTPAALDALFEGVDTVWHCAALSSPWGAYDDFYAANVRATAALAEGAVKRGVRRFVQISTPSIYFDYQHHANLPPLRTLSHRVVVQHMAMIRRGHEDVGRGRLQITKLHQCRTKVHARSVHGACSGRTAGFWAL